MLAMKRGDDAMDQTALAASTAKNGELGLAATLDGESDAIAESSRQSISQHSSSSTSASRGADMSRFMIIDELGAGGMGVVFSAYDPELDRKLAIKVLRPDVWKGKAVGEGKRRLMREAQAMGKLSHPHVITVYEVGHADDGGVFVAMEYVDGGTLLDWMKPRRKWREVVDKFTKAGRGLAAAHAAGLVHRDFKPDNVLIGSDGRVRVTDFGLVATIGQTALATSEPDIDVELSPAPHLNSSLTREGAVLGTPRYMAPEQHLGASVDASADQFSFCVALYQALYGKLPYKGRDYAAVREAIVSGNLESAPRGTDVPRHLARLLKRGLSVNPADRYPSMDALLRDLSYDPAVRSKRIVAGVVVASLAGIALYGFARNKGGATADKCPVPEAKFDDVWDSNAKARMKARFSQTSAPFAAESFDRAAKLLDSYKSRWLASRVDTCEATRVRGEQSPALLDLRMSCLDQRLGEFKALTTLLATGADSKLVASSAEAVYRLPNLDQCKNSVALTAAPPLPNDDASRERIRLLRSQLSEVRALRSAGKIKHALRLAKSVANGARSVAYKPIQAEALLALGQLELRGGQPTAAGKTLVSAANAAAAAKNDEAVAHAWLDLIYVRGYLQVRDAEATALVQSARAAITRAGGSVELRARLLARIALLAGQKGKLDDAVTTYGKAIKLIEDKHGKNHFSLVALVHNVALVHRNRGEFAEARAAFARELQIITTAFGARHPERADAISGLGIVLGREGRHADAEKHYRQALKIQQGALGKDNPLVAQSLNNVGLALGSQGKLEKARTFHQQALVVWRKALGNEHPNTTRPLLSLGIIAELQKRYDDAEKHLEEAVNVYAAAKRLNSPRLLEFLHRLAGLALIKKRYAKADELCKRSLANQATRSPHAGLLIESLQCMAKAALGLKQPAQARKHLERALAVARKHKVGQPAIDQLTKLRASAKK